MLIRLLIVGRLTEWKSASLLRSGQVKSCMGSNPISSANIIYLVYNTICLLRGYIMKGYGLPRLHDVSSPDLDAIQQFGLQSSAGNMKGIGGDIRSSFRNSSIKRTRRRYYKKRARALSKKECMVSETK